MATADDIRKLRDLTGQGLDACKRAFAMAEDPAQPFGGDVLWAICAVDAGGLAVNVQPPERRRAWNVERGAHRAAALRNRDPAIAEAYPAKDPDAAGPSPGQP